MRTHRRNPVPIQTTKSTIDATMAIKDFVQEGLAAREVIAVVSFDVQGAFDAAWWPGILKELREWVAPKTYMDPQRVTSSSEQRPCQRTT